MNMRMVSVAVAVVALGAFADDYAYSWVTGETPASLLEGKLALTYENGNVKTISAAPNATTATATDTILMFMG